MRDHVLGLDHIVVAASDLAGSAARWRELGFTVSPRGQHSDYLGTANHTIMFEDDYIELLGVLVPTAFNTPTRTFLETGAGIERIAMRTDDATAGLAALKRDGIEGTGPFEFRRPVALDDGGLGEAGFRIFQWPEEPAPGNVRLFACQHLTRETVWLPSLVRHANGARALRRIEIVAIDPQAEAALCARLLGLSSAPAESGAFTVAMRPCGADLVFVDAEAFARRWGHASAARQRRCGIVLAVDGKAGAEPHAEWAVSAGSILCAATDGALVGWEAAGEANR